MDYPPKDFQIPLEADPEYVLITESNAVSAEINTELQKVLRYTKEIYDKKFPELKDLLPNALDYSRAILRIRNEMDLTKVNFADILPSAAIMSLTVTATTTKGMPLTQEELQKVESAASLMIDLDAKRKKVWTISAPLTRRSSPSWKVE